MKPIVQVSLDVTSIAEALHLAEIAVRAGVDWLEAGTPLILAEGMHAVRALKQRFPDKPLVADLKTMDGGYLEAEMMAKAGADMVVVMGVATPATVRAVAMTAARHDPWRRSDAPLPELRLRARIALGGGGARGRGGGGLRGADQGDEACQPGGQVMAPGMRRLGHDERNRRAARLAAGPVASHGDGGDAVAGSGAEIGRASCRERV